ncbi:MAG: thiamine-phosphate pyrophosphorylase, partial [Thermomicrobiales bacterium]|nr:thiamine-phosphate pyrophosphorylase [Thermomicrobiales bacterium]
TERTSLSVVILSEAKDLSLFNLRRRLAVYLVADPEQTNRDLLSDVEAALAGGTTCVQLRAKRLTDRAVLDFARALVERCHRVGALFVMNDRIDLALAAGADGVHLGVDDLPLREARRLAGKDVVIGYSPETDEQTTQARDEGADYLGVGPVYGTVSKDDAGEAVGLETIRRRARLAAIPIIGIGGITPGNAGDVVRAGAFGVAVVGAILRASDPEQAARNLSRAVASARADERA